VAGLIPRADAASVTVSNFPFIFSPFAHAVITGGLFRFAAVCFCGLPRQCVAFSVRFLAYGRDLVSAAALSALETQQQIFAVVSKVVSGKWEE
jgi:hypothetical protein